MAPGGYARWRHRQDLWLVRHPWRYSTVGLFFAFLLVLMLRGPLLLALAVGAGWYAIVGWSLSRGPGRRLVERRLERWPPGQTAPPEPTLRPPPQFAAGAARAAFGGIAVSILSARGV